MQQNPAPLLTDATRASMLRVDQAGEFGATRIYAGQLAVLGRSGPHAAEIAGMARQEDAHLARFDALIAERGVRPTALQPLWSVTGFALGAVTASFVFFFSLGYGARLLRPRFANPKAWRVLDAIIGVTMLALEN